MAKTTPVMMGLPSPDEAGPAELTRETMGTEPAALRASRRQLGDRSAAPKPRKPEPAPKTPGEPESQTPAVPKYLTLERVEARLRPDQIDRLGQLRRRLMAARTAKTERFTENTIIRVAVDLLLEHGDELHGNTEDELRTSIGVQGPAVS
ncbi:hypothetical protein AB0H73_35710 [Streptomyces olivoreticuli]|uniref:hypothetical protein n=1 Tax=Streptomyces longwoodensis TaxID=68231 RepID=UPI0033C31C5C